MTQYRTLAIPTHVANAARSTGKAPGYEHPVHSMVATGYGPCRHCLSEFEVGTDNRTLFTYDPFADTSLPLPGPVYIHAESCPRYPESAPFPSKLKRYKSRITGYDSNQTMRGRVVAKGSAIDDAIDGLLADPEVSFLHVRNATAGCFTLTIERAHGVRGKSDKLRTLLGPRGNDAELAG
jgi:hypothetical protein